MFGPFVILGPSVVQTCECWTAVTSAAACPTCNPLTVCRESAPGVRKYEGVACGVEFSKLFLLNRTFGLILLIVQRIHIV